MVRSLPYRTFQLRAGPLVALGPALGAVLQLVQEWVPVRLVEDRVPVEDGHAGRVLCKLRLQLPTYIPTSGG